MLQISTPDFASVRKSHKIHFGFPKYPISPSRYVRYLSRVAYAPTLTSTCVVLTIRVRKLPITECCKCMCLFSYARGTSNLYTNRYAVGKQTGISYCSIHCILIVVPRRRLAQERPHKRILPRSDRAPLALRRKVCGILSQSANRNSGRTDRRKSERSRTQNFVSSEKMLFFGNTVVSRSQMYASNSRAQEARANKS